MVCSALNHSALISTGLPMRGVTTQSPIFGVHPGELHTRPPGIEQAVGLVDMDL